jgi:isocitrate dehydrogenase (NAD+)
MSEPKVTVTLIPGDGIGPEVIDATVELLDAAGAPVEWERVEAGGHLCATRGTAMPDEVIESIQRNRVALKGPITTPIGGGFASVNVTLRQKLDLYANLRPARSLPGIKTRYENVDLIVVRENTEDLYTGKEHMIVPGVVESLKIITEKASRNIARFAFSFARQNNRKKVTAVHKANIMKMSDGLFLDCCRAVAREYPDVEYNEVIVDNLCMQLVTDPTRYDVLVLENLYGDIVSDLCAGLVGGLGVVPAGNIGTECSVFEAVHGSAPDIAGQGKANPTAVMLSAVLMLRHLNQMAVADRIESAILKTLSEGSALTPDLRGTASTTEFTKAVIGNLQ